MFNHYPPPSVDERRMLRFWSGPEKEEKLEVVREQTLGAGSFGKCELIRDIHTDKYFCLKTCKLSHFDWLSSTIVEFEKSINFSHKNLVCSYFSWYDGAGQLQLITEYCQLGSLKKIMETQDLTSPQRISLAIQTAVQINNALAYLKKQTPPIFHRDIKWENVLVDSNGWIKLGDLGLAATHDLGQTHTQGAGTPTWLAPEVLQGRQYDYPSDQYSLALCVLRILKGHINNDGSIHIPPDCYDDSLQEYLESQLQSDPTKRMTAEEVVTLFKGQGSGPLKNAIKLPAGKERIVSPRMLPWQKTTHEERQINDELRRLATAFLDVIEDEKDPSVIASALELFPFTGKWTTKKGFIISRSPEGHTTVTQGYLPWNTPAKAAYIRNIQGREKEDEEDEELESGGTKSRHSRGAMRAAGLRAKGAAAAAAIANGGSNGASAGGKRPKKVSPKNGPAAKDRVRREVKFNEEEPKDEEEEEEAEEEEEVEEEGEEEEGEEEEGEEEAGEEEEAEEEEEPSLAAKRPTRAARGTRAAAPPPLRSGRRSANASLTTLENDAETDAMDTEDDTSGGGKKTRPKRGASGLPQAKRTRSAITGSDGPMAAVGRRRTKTDLAEVATTSTAAIAPAPAARKPKRKRGEDSETREAEEEAPRPKRPKRAASAKAEGKKR